MNTIILKNINILDIINQNNNLLTVKEVLKEVGYDIKNLYFDKFYNNIKDDIWIYIDNELILWLNYKEIRIGKEQIIKLLKKYFKEDDDYKILNNNEFDINNFCSGLSPEQNIQEETRGAHNKQYITVSPDCFKELCMYVCTSKSKEIKKYYIELEKIFKFYLQYQTEYQNIQLNQKDKQLEEKDKKINKYIQKQTKMIKFLEKTGYVYNDTCALNADNNISKIGRTNDPPKRLCNFNVNSLKNNQYYYTYIKKCYNPDMLEKLIHSFLRQFAYYDENEKREMFQLHYPALEKIIIKICDDYDNTTNMINDYIKNNYQKDLELDPVIPDEFDYYNEKQKEEYDINNDRITLEENIINYKGVKLYLCPRCNIFLCKEKTTMFNHLNRVYQCQENGKSKLTEDKIEDLVKENNIKLYPCTKCNKKVFDTHYHLNRHLNSLNPCDKQFKCDKCNKEFRLQDELNSHLNQKYCLDSGGIIINEIQEEIKVDNNIVISNNMTFYKCNLCKLLFKTKQNLRKHQNKKIKCNELHKCDKCSRFFHSIENLRKHQNKKISCINEIFECKKCKKQFSSNKNLKRHYKNVNCN